MLEEFVCMMNDMCEIEGGLAKYYLKYLLNESNFLFIYIHSTVMLIQCVKCISYTLKHIFIYIIYPPIP